MAVGVIRLLFGPSLRVALWGIEIGPAATGMIAWISAVFTIAYVLKLFWNVV
jgi:hypothetical protein